MGCPQVHKFSQAAEQFRIALSMRDLKRARKPYVIEMLGTSLNEKADYEGGKKQFVLVL